MNVGGAVVVSVQYDAGRKLVGFEACKCGSLPVSDNGLNLLTSRLIVGCPRNHATAVTPLMAAAVGHRGNQVWAAAQNLNRGASFACVVVILEQIPYC